jgi:hypothetical protein
MFISSVRSKCVSGFDHLTGALVTFEDLLAEDLAESQRRPRADSDSARDRHV